MHSNKGFIRNFEKTAALGIPNPLGTVAKTVGKGIMRIGGGPLNTALTGVQAVGDYNQNMAKMRQAAMR